MKKLNINNVVVCRCGNKHILGIICICKIQETMDIKKDDIKDVPALAESEYFYQVKKNYYQELPQKPEV